MHCNIYDNEDTYRLAISSLYDTLWGRSNDEWDSTTMETNMDIINSITDQFPKISYSEEEGIVHYGSRFYKLTYIGDLPYLNERAYEGVIRTLDVHCDYIEDEDNPSNTIYPDAYTFGDLQGWASENNENLYQYGCSIQGIILLQWRYYSTNELQAPIDSRPNVANVTIIMDGIDVTNKYYSVITDEIYSPKGDGLVYQYNQKFKRHLHKINIPNPKGDITITYTIPS